MHQNQLLRHICREFEIQMTWTFICIAISPQLYGWLTGIGAVITAPEEACNQYKTYLQKQLDLYN